jgi:hypothetical protein
MSSEALWGAVARLTERPRTRLERDGGKGEWVTVDSLFEQLIEAMESGAGNGRGHSKPGSRPPCDTTAMSLLIEIAEAVRDACIGLELKRRHDTPDDLRQVCSRIVSLAVTEGNDELDWWTAKISEWCAQIRITISNDPDRTWRLNGFPCPDCGADAKIEIRDGYHYRVPVIEVMWRDGLVRAVTCTVCTFTAMRGSEFDEIAARGIGESVRLSA